MSMLTVVLDTSSCSWRLRLSLCNSDRDAHGRMADAQGGTGTAPAARVTQRIFWGRIVLCWFTCMYKACVRVGSPATVTH